ncbi:MAG: response regulator transcription factor [Geodermatophilaceae bacterium]|nr:response regulator transcription factor [Geodermatophilaceae bacterium]
MGENATRILVVDDEPGIIDVLSASLRFVGFDVRTAESGREALSAAADFGPELLVLDVMLPDMDGFTVCRELRERGMHMPVVFLSARDRSEDKISGLSIGGDDYVTKPFGLEELIARINAVLRRTRGSDAGRVLRLGDLELDQDSYEVRRGGRPVHLSATEFALLRYLLVNTGRVLSRAQILDHVWHYDFAGESTVVETFISYLRRKLDNGGPALIHTVRGVGYSMRLPRT